MDPRPLQEEVKSSPQGPGEVRHLGGGTAGHRGLERGDPRRVVPSDRHTKGPVFSFTGVGLGLWPPKQVALVRVSPVLWAAQSRQSKGEQGTLEVVEETP